MTMAHTESWHLSKSVPVTLIIGLTLQAGGVVWMFSQMSSDIDNNSKRIERLDAQVEEITDTAQAQAVQLGRIETRLDALMDQSDRILRALEAK
jgi:outer membrane murein-binding lipoprotein Lpp